VPALPSRHSKSHSWDAKVLHLCPKQIIFLMKRFFIFLLLFTATLSAFAQNTDLLFGPKVKSVPRKGWILTANADFDIPAGDMAKRFGLSYRIGPGILYKTTSNWIFGPKCDFILGGNVKQDSLMANIMDKYKGNEFINNSGIREGVPTYERGYMLGWQVGKIITLSKTNADNGILLMTSGGFMQHKIDIYVKDKDIPQLSGDYLKGYDRLTNGLFAEEYVAYNYMARDGLLNFHIGLDGTFGFTQGRRTWLYDVNRSGLDKRIDILFGIRGGWYLPIFKRKSEDMLFE